MTGISMWVLETELRAPRSHGEHFINQVPVAARTFIKCPKIMTYLSKWPLPPWVEECYVACLNTLLLMYTPGKKQIVPCIIEENNILFFPSEPLFLKWA